ncbi:hypothetical protein LVD15_21815 [Fulvivirga maritima]|uniref:hypothetical protein n=1 Tax=Fulvivirga maritima TaxID=2904247 RepID=UPI001F2AF1E5|nr:hypothetical protein [Fulvivirga maritima]UII25910.1 hypothetical protein LVD15_21815 [Fulvivirga maritima]
MRETEKLKIGITTCSMGNGHWMKAIAIQAALKERGVEAEIVDESQALSPGAEKAMKFFEGIYNMASKSRVLQKINEFISSGKNSYLAGWFEYVISKLNAKGPALEYDCIISTYPTIDKVAKIAKDVPIIRLLPDIYAHDLYFEESKRPITYVVSSKKLKKRIAKGKEAALTIKPKKSNIFNTGTITHPKSAIYKEDDGTLLLKLGGAGAQQALLLAILEHIEHDNMVVFAHSNQEFYEKLIAQTNITVVSEPFYYTDKYTIIYHEDKRTALEAFEEVRQYAKACIAKPGDVTSAGTAYLLLYPIGLQEIDNANWSNTKGFTQWALSEKEMQLSEYEQGKLIAQGSIMVFMILML